MSTVTKRYLKEAVHHHKSRSRTGMLERLFTRWFNGFVYNQIWEDPRVDAEALQIDGHSRILTISSGGCNVLNYLVHQPEKVVAVDLNTCHIHLTRLKLAALEHLPGHEEFFNFFGLGNQKVNQNNYQEHIRGHLPEDTRKYWERRGRIKYFSKGFYNRSKLGLFLRFVHMMGRITRRNPEKLLQAKTIEEQERIFNEVYAPFFDAAFIRWLGKMPVTVFSLGIPPSQHQAMKREAGGHLIDEFRDRVKKLACGFPLEDNYFAWQGFGRRYDETRRAVPDYLKAEHYELLRNSLDRVDVHNVSLTDYLRTQPDASLNRFVFLDSQDWMPPHVIADLWTEVARAGQPGTRVIFRTAGIQSPIEAALPPELMTQFNCEEDVARELHDKDRSAIYGMFHLYTKPN